MDEINLTEVKKRFDDVLVKHIRRLIEIDTLAASLSFNLATVACLMLIVERENEIKRFPAAPPERYTRETFLDDLANIGLEINDELMVAFQGLTQLGYVEIKPDGKYIAQISAYALVSFLDNLFPGMPGMSLIAYVVQMIEEVSTGRKNVEEAIEQFDQTLMSRGVALSDQKIKSTEKQYLHEHADRIERRVAAPPKSPSPISENVKRAFKDRLSRIRSTVAQDTSMPSIFTSGGMKTKRVEIKDVFPRMDDEPPEMDAGEIENVEASATEVEKTEAVEAPVEEAVQESPKPAPEPVPAPDPKPEPIPKPEPEPVPETEPEPEPEPAPLPEPPATKTATPVVDENPALKTQASIEKQIAAFEAALAMACPLCHQGKIFSETTEKGQHYYSCSNPHCGFISWGKPYAFPCPLCKSPFLIEFEREPGAPPGLKCPRSTCSFSQDHLGDPAAVAASAASTDDSSPKKKKRLIRRVRRKK